MLSLCNRFWSLWQSSFSKSNMYLTNSLIKRYKYLHKIQSQKLKIGKYLVKRVTILLLFWKDNVTKLKGYEQNYLKKVEFRKILNII